MSTGVMIAIALVSAAVSLGMGIYSYTKTKEMQANAGEIGNTDINVTHASEGMPIPIIYGECTLTGNIIWWKYYDDETDGGTAGNYNAGGYRAISIWQAICMGKIQNKWTIYRNDDLMGSQPNLVIGPTWETWFPDADKGPNIWNRGFYDILINVGDQDPTNPNTIPKKIDGVTPIETYAAASRGVANCFIRGLLLGPSEASCPTLRYKMRKDISDVAYDLGESAPSMYDDVFVNGSTYVGSNPAHIIYDLLTDDQYGLGMSSSNIDIENFEEAAAYFYDEGLGLNFIINNHAEARDAIAKIQAWVDCLLVVSSDNKYQIKIMKDTDASVATMTDVDFIDGLVLQRKSWDDTYNDFVADYTPGGGWAQKTLNVKNEANIAMTGSVRQKKIDLTAFTNIDIASKRLHSAMKKESYPFASGQATTNLKFAHVAEGDVVTISSSEYAISALFRVISKDTTEIDQNKVGFQLIQMTELIADSNYEDAGDPQGEDPTFDEYYIIDTIDENEPNWESTMEEQGDENDIENSFLNP